MNSTKKLVTPLFFLYIVLNGGFIAASSLLKKYHLDPAVLVIANTIFLLVSLLVFYLQKKAIANPNPNVFIRSVMSGMLIKMAVTVFALILYRLLAKNSFNAMTAFFAVFLYLIYMIVEVRLVMKLNKKPNA